ncbi:MAG: hypothetical protein ACFCUG_09025 [Thiotrichales bacterium]
MNTKLVQKHYFKGSREFELADDEVNVKISMPFLEKEYTVVLSALDSEPVMRGSTLAFVSAVNGEPLVEFFIDNPDPETFKDFVDHLRQRVTEESFGKPREYEYREVSVAQLEISLQMLRTYVSDESVKPFMDSMEALKCEPEDPARFDAMCKSFKELGLQQGAVLTYAPYLVSLFSNND